MPRMIILNEIVDGSRLTGAQRMMSMTHEGVIKNSTELTVDGAFELAPAVDGEEREKAQM